MLMATRLFFANAEDVTRFSLYFLKKMVNEFIHRLQFCILRGQVAVLVHLRFLAAPALLRSGLKMGQGVDAHGR